MYSKILVALDGSETSRQGGHIALSLAGATGAEIVACHVYSAELHARRFSDMEPGLPERYQDPQRLATMRDAHGSLIQEGFQALSAGYMDDFSAEAKQAGVSARSEAVSGANYVGIVQLAEECGADLVAVGAHGLGAADDGFLGSTAARVLRHCTCDVLVVRRACGGGGIVAGVDGSDEAHAAVATARDWAAVLGGRLLLAATYDPDFHTAVFREIGQSLSSERRSEINLTTQEDLHDELINDGLATLYQEFLDAAAARLGDGDPRVETCLLQGKAYRALTACAREKAADLLVVGRYGHHRQQISLLGSNAEAISRVADTNVLIAAGGDRPGKPSESQTHRAAQEHPGAETAEPMLWDEDARARLERIPAFVRPMARRAIEKTAREQGSDRVTGAVFEEVARRFGMGGTRGDG